MSHDLQTAATELLQQLIRFDTVNPPGNERLLQELLLGELTSAGFDCELLGARAGAAEPGRAAARRSRTARRCACSATSTPCSRMPTSGRTTPGPATSPTASCGAAARST